MVGRKRRAPGTARRRNASASQASAESTRSTAAGDVPQIVQDMLTEAGAGPSRTTSGVPERPLKRRRPGNRPQPGATFDQTGKPGNTQQELVSAEEDNEAGDEEDDIEFEDVALPPPTIQTIYLDTDDDDDEDEDVKFEDVDIGSLGPGQVSGSADSQVLELNLTAHKQALPSRRSQDRRKPLSKAEKERRVEIHKMHLLCVLVHVSKRNHWCNDLVVQEALRSLLTSKMVTYLNPPSKLSQFGQTESLKNGAKMVSDMFKIVFEITERGARRALWAEEEEHLKDYQLPDDIDSCFMKSDFRKLASSLRGSRDVGAQLFCALLRAAGVEARLVCSLQPLSFVPGGPTLPKPRGKKIPAKQSKAEEYRAQMTKYDISQTEATGATPSPRRRLGHPNAAAYNIPDISAPSPSSARRPAATPKRIHESPFPVYWVEVLDEAHQKWAPVDPLVTGSQWKPGKLEPPASDKENTMSYVIAFEADGSAKDVTRRYAKAFNSKTRRMRIDGPVVPGLTDVDDNKTLNGERWWRKVMKYYARRIPTDLDQIENQELLANEAREPMPGNVQDFKDHPVYALERHLRRHEVLRPGAQMSGTVGAGSRGPLEKIYRRRDVQTARSPEKWYRLGREIKPGEQPVKVLPKKAVRKSRISFHDSDPDSDSDEEEEDPVLGTGRPSGTPLFTLEQTTPYVPDPVVNGRVPKNKFGNLDVYVPSMVPAGGTHIVDERAAHAAFVLGVDYAPALTGFQFRGRKGTAVLTGVIVPAESAEAVRAVIDGFGDLEAEAEEQRRAARALRMWRRFLMELRIRERIWANVGPGEEDDEEEEEEEEDEGGGQVGVDKGKGVARDEEEDDDAEMEDAPSDVTEEYYMDEDDEGGGFLIE